MNRRCPFCEADISPAELAEQMMPACPKCGSSLPVEIWNPASTDDEDDTPSAVEDEITVDFSLVDDSQTEEVPKDTAEAKAAEAEVLDEQAIDWLEDTVEHDGAQAETGVAAVTELSDSDLAEERPLQASQSDATVAAGHSPEEAVPPHGDIDLDLDLEAEAVEALFEGDAKQDISATAAEPDENAFESVPEDAAVQLETPEFAPKEGGDGEASAVDDLAPLFEDDQPPSSLAMDDIPSGAAAAAAKQPFEMESADDEKLKRTGKARRGVLDSLIRGVLLTVGLIAGAFVLQLLCWWAFKWDPLNVALMLPKKLAMLTPHSLTEEGRKQALQKKFRSTSDATSEETDGAGVGAESGAGQPAQTESMTALPDTAGGSLPPDNNDPALESGPDDSLAAADPEPDTSASTAEIWPEAGDDDAALPAPRQPEESPPMAENIAVPDDGEQWLDDLDPTDDGATDDDQDLMADPAFLEAEAGENAALYITNVPVYRPMELQQAIDSATNATNALNDAKRRRVESAQLKKVARDFYVALCDLSERATLVEADSADDELAAARAQLASLAQDASKLRMVGTSAAGWVARELGNGVLVAGTIESVQDVGKFQELTIRPVGRNETLLVITTESGGARQSLLTVGRNILLGGYIVRDPESQLPGYFSGASSVIWMRDLIVATP